MRRARNLRLSSGRGRKISPTRSDVTAIRAPSFSDGSIVAPRHLVRVVLWMTGALLSFSAMAVSIRALAETLSVIEILAVRSGLGLAVMATLAAARADLRSTIFTRQLPLHFFRNIVHLASQYVWATSLLLLPLATVFALEFTAPAWALPLALIGSDPLFVTKLDLGQLPAVLGIGISGLASHYCLANAFRAGDATVVVPLDFLRIPLIAVVGWWLYGEPLDAFVFAGAALIIAGILWNLRSEAARAVAPIDAKKAALTAAFRGTRRALGVGVAASLHT